MPSSAQIIFRFFLLTLLAGSACLGAEPSFHQEPLFVATKARYYHIPGLVVTAKGTVLAYAESRDNRGKDWCDIHVELRRSTNGGISFDAARQITHPDPSIHAIVRTSPPKPKGHGEDLVVGNPVAIADRNGAVHLVYCVEYRRVFYMRSDDDGLTWSAPVEISQVFEKYRPYFDWKIAATGPGHGIQLQSGRLIVPFWLATGDKLGYSHFPSVTSVLYSDDHGATWNAGDIVARSTGTGDNPDVYHNPNETEAVELADGHVLFNIRAPSFRHKRLEAESPDGVNHWTKPVFVDDLTEPIDFGSIVRYSKAPDRNRLLFSICGGHAVGKKKPTFDEQGFIREDMTVFISEDEGKTWPVKKVILPGPAGCGYSDLAVLPDKTILCACGYGTNFGRGAGIVLARFNLEWLTAGKP
jgi:sialidase-1